MSATVTLINETSTPVYFGLWSAPNNHAEVDLVAANSKKTVTLPNYDARIVGVWINDDILYPNNDSPFLASMVVVDNVTYTITLTTTGLTIQ